MSDVDEDSLSSLLYWRGDTLNYGKPWRSYLTIINRNKTVLQRNSDKYATNLHN